jgi:hypothetical protein
VDQLRNIATNGDLREVRAVSSPSSFTLGGREPTKADFSVCASSGKGGTGSS